MPEETTKDKAPQEQEAAVGEKTVSFADRVSEIETELTELSAKNKQRKDLHQERQIREQIYLDKVAELEADLGHELSEDEKLQIHRHEVEEWLMAAQSDQERFKILNTKLLALEAFDRIYDQHPSNEARIKNLQESLELYLKGITTLDRGERQKIIKSLENCLTIEDKQKFIEAIFSIVEPLMEMRRKADEYIPIGTSGLTMEILNTEVKLHFNPNEKGSLEMLNRIKNEDFPILADFLKENSQIKEVSGYSWLVRRLGSRFKKWGFQLSEDTYIDNAGRDAGGMTMSSEEFLKRYG